MKQYRRWQNLYTTLKPAEQGYMPTAIEYEEFQQWLKKQDSGYFSDVFEDVAEHIKPSSPNESPVGFICRHPMHPAAAGHLRPRCHVCVIDMHLTYMKVLTKALEDAGGRAPSCTLTASVHQEKLYKIWVQEKLETVRRLGELERCAEEEAEWQPKLQKSAAEDTRTAEAALKLYWSEIGGCAANRPQAPRKKKTVGFTPDTEFSPRRPQAYYWRRSPRYQPGKYPVVEVDNDGHEEELVSEDSEDYSQPMMLDHGVIEIGGDSHDFSQARIHVNDLFRCGREKDQDEIPSEDLVCDDMEELEEDDGDSDWEDVESDDDTLDDGDYIFFDVEDDSSFVVFSED
jgi:hypothetical protein